MLFRSHEAFELRDKENKNYLGKSVFKAVENENGDNCIGVEMPEGTVINLEVSGNKFSADIPNIPPCTLSPEEGQSLIKEFMRETNVILFLKSSFDSSDLPGCEGKIIGTNVPQGGTVSTGDTLIFIIANSQEDQ